MKRLFLISISIFTFATSALEVDNFLGENRNLRDSSTIINDYINYEFQQKIYSIPLNILSNQSKCAKIHSKLVRQFRRFIIHKIEKYLERVLDKNYLFPSPNISDHEYYKKSIYNNGFFEINRFVSLSRNINVNGIIIGTDKLSHFISTGFRYHSFYKNILAKGVSSKKALEKVIRIGVFTENTILGKMSSGVFSFGDLEANYQGLLFNQNFCNNSDNSYLTFENGIWKLGAPFDIRDYINPYWNEVFNPSYFSKRKWKHIEPKLIIRYCGITQEALKSRLHYYHSIAFASKSFEYLSYLRDHSQTVPDTRQQYFWNLCH